MESNENKNNWEDIKVFICGVEVKGIKHVNYKKVITLSDLESKLLIAEEKEQYELCAELKKQIDELKSGN